MRRPTRRTVALGSLLAAALLAAGAWLARGPLIDRLPPRERIALLAWRHGLSVDHDVRIATADGTVLAASVYLPRRRDGPVPAVLIRLPYDRFRYGEGFWSAILFGGHGYAVVVQDLRGTGGSTGRLLPWAHAGADGVATLDWIVSQPWSNGRVGTFGCSALGETQFPLARLDHPAHRAMIASGAGGAIGSARGRHGYFGVFEGGVFQLASGFGWFAEHGATDPRAAPPAPFDAAAVLRGLPVADLVSRVRPAPNGYAELLATPPGDPRWSTWGYWTDGDRSRVPALMINTWGDQTVQDTLALAEAWRDAGTPHRVVVAPGAHCDHDARGRGVERFGDLAVAGAHRPWDRVYVDWFDRWLRDAPAPADEPAYEVFVLGEDRWIRADAWPPASAVARRWYLSSGGRANSRRGDGRLHDTPPAAGGPAFDAFRYDPDDPVPTRGGPVCCTGDPRTRAGPVDQADVEARDDVLVFTSAPLEADLRIAGPLRAHLTVSTDVPDTDLVARLVHVRPDGTAIGVQEGALRLRFRDGVDRPRPMVPGEPVEVVVDMRSIAWTVPRGHRIRLHVTGSSFPRLERNLNTGAPLNAAETRRAVATTRIHHGAPRASWLELHALPAGG